MRFAITDIHGNARTFAALLDEIQLGPNDDLYLLGDYVDRGPDSKGVIDRILRLQKEGYRVHCLRGNHEDELLKSHRGGGAPSHTDWCRYWGGRTTLNSYGQDRVSDEHLAWIEDLNYYFALDDYILVHAGLDFRGSEPLSKLEAMLWQRRWYDEIDQKAIDWLGNRTVVHGHTPIPRRDIETMIKPAWTLPVLNIDAGCYKEESGMGYLCAFNLDKRKLHFVERMD